MSSRSVCSAASPYPLAGERATSSKTSTGSAAGRSSRIRIRRSPTCAGAAGGDALDGIEWLNVDSEWRDETVVAPARRRRRARWCRRRSDRLAVRAARSTLQRWDARCPRACRVRLAAVDAHARIGWARRRGAARRDARSRCPRYETMFRTVDAGGGARRAADRRRGRRRRARARRARARPIVLGRARARRAGALAVHRAEPRRQPSRWAARRVRPERRADVRARACPSARRARRAAARRPRSRAGRGSVEHRRTPTPACIASKRIARPRRRRGWCRIRSSSAPPTRRQRSPRPARRRRVAAVRARDRCRRVERSSTTPRSIGDGARRRRRAAVRLRLGAGAPAGQYVALATSRDASTTASIASSSPRRADRPMRLSVQVRLPRRHGRRSAGASVYVDDTPRPITRAAQRISSRPIATTTRRPDRRAACRALLFVVDTREHAARDDRAPSGCPDAGAAADDVRSSISRQVRTVSDHVDAAAREEEDVGAPTPPARAAADPRCPTATKNVVSSQ